MNKIILFFSMISSLSADAVMINEMLTQKHSLRLDTSIFYANIQKQTNVIAPVIATASPTDSSSVYSIPAILGVQQSNQDFLNFSLNLRYGITKDIEIFASPSFFYQHSNLSDSAFSGEDDYDFNNFNMGLLYQVKSEGKYPSLLIGTTPIVISKSILAAPENPKYKLDYFKNYAFFATSYYTVDPVVFVLQGGFRLNLHRKIDDHTLDIGNLLNLSPMVYLALNPYTSINFGINYQYKFKDRLDGIVIAHQGSSISYLFGASYEVNPSLIVSVDINNLSTNLYTSNSVNVLLSYKIR
ncbi:hypothetical protein [Helicobacter cappadocius]|uniref:Transporter n=1 Tax=Helicobacter cappadocius TaxID=3063998 RepID=A0AA90PQT4_9HELI|nr:MULTISPECIES: hypothetical protein [unclassified Helicobacter]MDO7253339.1 hypothetical protein [Helicobacter sp. faydin-H75]MDP2539231.1 hypothetical protein [Helicobacter sp. faydin-H76]